MTLPFARPAIAAYSHLLAASFARWTNQFLIKAEDIPEALYHAPFALVSHGTETDPVFRYANLTAQALWGIGWDEFIRMHSRLSAEPALQEERQRLLDEAAVKGYVDNYQGVRIAKDGRKFIIQKTILWNVTDENGLKHGQAALIRQWEWL